MSAKTFESLTERYSGSGPVVVTAHRGFSGQCPENTLEAFEQAVALEADFVEFDVRSSRDGAIVIMHDATVDRTTDGKGEVTSLSLAQLKSLNASYWSGPHDTGARLSAPARPHAPIPTLEEALALLAGRVFLNIQVYTQGQGALEGVCKLYRRFGLRDSAFLMVSSFAVGEAVRAFDKAVEICVGESREDLARRQNLGIRFVQPTRNLVTPAFCEEIQRRRLFANMFYANTAEDCSRYMGMGIRGVMSDRADVAIKAARRGAGAGPAR